MPSQNLKSACETNLKVVQRGTVIFSICLGAVGLSLLLMGCAAQGGPSGGPVDKSGPTLLTCTPADGAVRVPLQPTIELLFSEPINPRSAEGTLTVFPRLTPAPQVTVTRRKVAIKLSEPLQPNCTYVFSFGRNLCDYQNNPSAAEIKLALTTGDSLNEGRIAGWIYDLPANTTAHIYLFTWTENLPDSILRREPDFIASTDALGKYQFTNLPPGSYRALASTAKSWRTLSGDDLVALPNRAPLCITGRTTALEAVDFRLSKLDWQPFRLLTVNCLRGQLELNFSHEIAEASLPTLQVEFVPEAGPVRRVWCPPTNRKQLYLPADGLIANREYRLTVSGLRNIYDKPLVSSTVNFTYKATVDTVAPTIVGVYPKPNSRDVPLATTVRIDFSKPLDSLDYLADIAWLEQDSLPVAFTAAWRTANALELTPQAPLHSNCAYQLQLDLRRWRDTAGNALRDSMVTVKFSTVDIAKFGTITGKVSLSACNYRDVYLEARLVGSSAISARTQPDSLGNYRLENLLPGQYQISIWADRNQNQRFDYGEVLPYQPAEVFRTFATPINVRARWETAEVNWEF